MTSLLEVIKLRIIGIADSEKMTKEKNTDDVNCEDEKQRKQNA